MGCCRKEGAPNAPPEVKKHLTKYYDKCRKTGKDKEYCSRVAWQILCMHKMPDYEGCTSYGKTEGPPYSAPLSKKSEADVLEKLVEAGKIEEAAAILVAFEWTPGDQVQWSTFGGDSYDGVVTEIDSNVLVVRCSDGKTRYVEASKVD